VAQRPRVAGGDDAADRGPVVGRIEGEHLPGAREGLARLRHRTAGLQDRGEVALVVLDDRVELGQAQLGQLHRPPPAELRPAPHDAHAGGLAQRGRHAGGVPRHRH
jgi:hypothetical protein